MTPFSLYLHIPFCRHRCAYCDFNTYAGLEHLIEGYTRALCREIELAAAAAGRPLPVHTVFFGGGTPSLLPVHAIAAILERVTRWFDLSGGAEITLEANPVALDQGYLNALRALGVNRLSLGMQSAHPDDLRLLERAHDFLAVSRAVARARMAGFDNLNLDLIFGIPEQDLARWAQTLELALGLAPDHFSLYSLIFEHGTPMNAWMERGLLAVPDDDRAADMYELAAERLAARGYRQYEISNWEKPAPAGTARACRHNLQYWRNEPYLGFGAGAHGFAAGVRTANTRGPEAYIRKCLAGAAGNFPVTPATVNARRVDREAEMGETMMMGLRLVEEGVSAARFRARFDTELEGVFEREIEDLTGEGILEWTGDPPEKRLRLTPRGRLLGNRAFMRFV